MGSLTPTFVASPGTELTGISAGTNHTCAVKTNGTALCWGHNNHGQLGDGTTTDRLNPTLVPDISSLLTASLGGTHSCVWNSARNLVYCWGLNQHGQLGDGTTANRLSPVEVVP